jgi:flagellar basal body-associated protein FliL
MENENNSNINTVLETKSTAELTPSSTKKLSKKSLILIIVAVIMLIVLTTYYFVNRRTTVDVYIPTIEEKANAVEQTIQETKQVGLPDDKTQIDIMKFNSQE